MPRLLRLLANPIAELMCILIAINCAGVWTMDARPIERVVAEFLGVWSVFAVIWLLIARRLGVHLVQSNRNIALSLRRTAEAWAATWGIAGMLVISTVSLQSFNLWVTLLTGFALLSLLRFATSYSSKLQMTGRPRAIVIGACPSARALPSTRDVTEAMDFIGFVSFHQENAETMPHLVELAKIEDLSQTLQDNRIDIAFVSPSDDASTGEVHRAIDTCEQFGLQTQYFPSFLAVDGMNVGMTWSASRPGLNVQAISEHSIASIGKRILDIVGCVIGITLLLPVILACAAAIKLTSPGPILYRQTRIGKSGRSFNCLKFRTMRVGAHAQQELLRSTSLQDGPAFKMPNDPRITAIGGLLRKFSLDELPQLLNVLFGDMSLVGPRPPIPSEVENYTWWQRRRISIKPGLTCVWQVYGRNQVSFKRWVEMDLFYIDNWSLWMDIKLIFHTVRVVLRGTGM